MLVGIDFFIIICYNLGVETDNVIEFRLRSREETSYDYPESLQGSAKVIDLFSEEEKKQKRINQLKEEIKDLATKEVIDEADLPELNTKLGELKEYAGEITVAIAIAASRIGIKHPEIINQLPNYRNIEECLTQTILKSSNHPSVARARKIAILALAERPGIHTIDNPQSDDKPEPLSVS